VSALGYAHSPRLSGESLEAALKKKHGTFVFGVATGVALAYWWRPLLKGTIRAGIQAEGTINKMVQVAREELQDVVAEATEKSGPAVTEKLH